MFNSITACDSCNLYLNQKPLIQKSNSAEIFWVGLSAVKTSDNRDIPLSNNTNSGKLINSIEYFIPEKSFHKTNLVKCLPLKNDKIRYPTIKEMKNCFFNLEKEINYLKPNYIFLLGKQVASFILNHYGIKEYSLNDEFDYNFFNINSYKFIPIHHPSFILIYKRKKLQKYIDGIEAIIRGNSQRSMGYV